MFLKWRDIQSAKGYRDGRPLWLKGENVTPYLTIGYWSDGDWQEIGTEGETLVGVTHWAPFS